MGVTTVKVKVKKSREAKRLRTVEFLVDSGAVYSVVAAKVLKGLGCQPYRKKDFYLGDEGGNARGGPRKSNTDDVAL